MSDPNIPGDMPADIPGAGAAPGGMPPGAAGAGGQQQPSEEEVRQYLAKLRQTDVTEIVAQAFSMVASGAEVKLGRRDGRLLIDVAAAIADVVEPHLDDRLTDQMQEALAQLREGQIDAEGQLQQLREEGRLPEEEDNDLPRDGAAPAADAGGADADEDASTPSQQPRPRPSGSGGRSNDRLWVPGR